VSQLSYAWVYGEILFPTWQRVVRKRAIGARRALIEGTQWLEADRVTRLQGEALRELLVQAGAHIPFYKELFAQMRFDPRAIASREDIVHLPLLTRDTVRARYADLVHPAYRGRNIKKRTSGTSGVPLRFEYSNDSETWRQATRLRAYEWAGYRQGLPTLHYWGTGTNVPRGLRAVKANIDCALRRESYVDCGRQDDESMRAMVRLIEELRPHAIIAYTHALATFARWVLDRNARTWGDVAVIGGAEAMLPSDRDPLKRVFGRGVFETYGARETMLIAAECEAHDGLHVSEENLLVEIVREDGRPVSPGETGAVAVTDLHNPGMPLVRYVNGDVATWGPENTCTCGRTLRRIARVDGRRNDTMRDARGAPVPGMVFISLLNAHEAEIQAFQAVQKRSGEVLLRIVPGREWSNGRFDGTAQRLAAYFEGLPFEIMLVDEIPADPSGKWRAVVAEPC
jgi:phenylacetate-CoA ligase